MINISYDLQAATADVDGVLIEGVTRSRARALPGLVSEAPDTSVLYQEAVSALGSPKVVWDVGAGSGVGSRVLAGSFERVVAIDPDACARAFASKLAPSAVVLGSLEGAPAPDAAVVIDVLGHAASPYELLRTLRTRVACGAKVFVAEAIAHPLQALRPPARRAFSRGSLKTLATTAGFAVSAWVMLEGSFLACVLTAVDDASAASLERAAVALSNGDQVTALAEYTAVQGAGSKGIRREAMLAEADLRLARGEGDLACLAFMRARGLDSTDVRALAALSQIACDSGEIDSALSMARQAVAADATDPSSAVALAVALHAQGDHAGSASAWRRANSLMPDHPLVASRWAAAALAMGDPTGALLTLERCRAYGDPWPAETYVTMTTVLLALGRKQDARAEIRIAVATSPTPEVMETWKKANG